MNRAIARNIVFPTILAVRGERLRGALKNLERTQWFSLEEIEALQLAKLKSLISHAYSTVPFYRQRLDELDLKPHDVATLDDVKLLPLLEKGDVAKLASTVHLPRMKARNFSVRMTAGTSGIPTTIYVDRNTNTQSLAARYRSQGWHGLKIGFKEARFWGRALTARDRRSTILKDLLLNRLRIAPDDLNHENIEHTIDRIGRFKPDYFYGYSSMIVRLGDYVEKSCLQEDKFGLKTIITSCEKSMDWERDRLSRIFGCPTVDEYGCSEVDIIAFECPNGSCHIMAENVLVEIVESGVSPRGTGEVIVTDLNNRLMPLIRYRLGDIASLDQGTCSCGRGLPVLKSIVGRDQNQYIRTPAGDLVHSVIFAYFFERLVEKGVPLKQFRVVQRTLGELDVQIVLENLDSNTRDMIDLSMEDEITPALGEGLICSVQYVDRVKFSDSTGKFSYFEALSDTDAGSVTGTRGSAV